MFVGLRSRVAVSGATYLTHLFAARMVRAEGTTNDRHKCEKHMSVLNGPGEGTWSVFAAKVVAERDALRSQLENVLDNHVEGCWQARCFDAERNRDLAITQLRHAEADAEQAVAYAEQERERAERERNVLVEMLVYEFDWQDTTYLHAMMHVENAIRNLRADLAVASKTTARCACQWEAGDSPCPTHGEHDERRS